MLQQANKQLEQLTIVHRALITLIQKREKKQMKYIKFPNDPNKPTISKTKIREKKKGLLPSLMKIM